MVPGTIHILKNSSEVTRNEILKNTWSAICERDQDDHLSDYLQQDCIWYWNKILQLTTLNYYI